MSVRSCPTVGGDAVARLGAVLVGGLVVFGLSGVVLGDGAAYYRNGQAVDLELVDNHVTIELTPNANRDAVCAQLANSGMPTVVTPTRSTMGSRLRLVPVTQVGDAVLNQIRAVQGIGQARKLYRETATGRFKIATDQIVVRFRDDLTQAQIDACLSSKGLQAVRSLHGLNRTYVVKVTDAAADVVQLAAALYQDDRTVYSHPDFVVDIRRCQITDEFYSQQWHLNNTGQGGADPNADVDWPQAWDEVSSIISSGSVRVAIHDDSVQRDHEDLADAYVTGFDFTDRDSDPSPGWSDDNHGTCVAGVALARINEIGVVGAAPTSSLIGIRWWPFDSSLAEGFLFALTTNADIINNSWGGYSPPADVLREAIEQVAANGRSGKGMVVVFSAGNEYTTVSMGNPIATLPDVLAIGASNSNDVRSEYSNVGAEVCVVAPSNDTRIGPLGITTTDVEDDAGLPTKGYNEGTGTDIYGFPDLLNGNYTQNFGGTSSAAPLASGVIALILGVNPNLTNEQIRRVLEHTADQIDASPGQYDPITGHSDEYGYGRINAYQAVVAAKASGSGLTWPPPVSDLTITGTSTVNMRWENPTEELASVMVVESTTGEITWVPDGIRTETGANYEVGDFVAPGVEVVQNDARQTYLDESPRPGAHYFAVFVRNSANRWSWGRSISTILGAKSSPMASVAAGPRAGAAPLTVHFTGGAIDPDMENTVFTYNWDFGDGTVASGQGTSHKYTKAGTYMAKLTVTDQSGLSGEAMVMIQVSDAVNESPLARILIAPGDGTAPHTVQLLAQASDADGTIDQYAWNFGDGTVAAGLLVEHTYTQTGTYPVTLEVVDDKGTSTQTTVTVSVWEAGPELPNAGTQACGTCGTAGGPVLITTMLGWGLLHVRRRRQ